MQPSDLFLEVAKREAGFSDGVYRDSEREKRLTQAWELLRNRGASVVDRFEAAGEVDREDRVRGYPDIGERLKVIKRVLEFEVPAPYELARLIDPQHEQDEVNLGVRIGCHDLSYSNDHGVTWDEPSRCVSLDILTTVNQYKDDEGNEVLQRLERSNYMYPVLDNPYSATYDIDRIPERDYFSPEDAMHRIEGFHCGLDLAEQYLTKKALV